MKHLSRLFLPLLSSVCIGLMCPIQVQARGGHSGARISSGASHSERAYHVSSPRVYVRGYTTRPGRVFRSYTRRYPSTTGRARADFSSGSRSRSYRISEPRTRSIRIGNWINKYNRLGETSQTNRIHRSAAAKDQFELMTGHPHGWPGHVVDHIIPLACGGADAPSNMQWQTVAEGKAKDKWERKGCRSSRH